MRLPNARAAAVERHKVTGYLLNVSHPDGAGKARFFMGVGFAANDWRALADSLR